MIRPGLLLVVPAAPPPRYALQLPPIWVFIAGILGVAVLADWIRAATEQLAGHTGPAVGGLLTVSPGSVAELLLALFWLLGRPMTLVFEDPLDLFAIAGDGESTWFEACR